MDILEMAKKFNVLRDAMSPNAQERSLAKADQMLAEIFLSEKREDRRPTQAQKPTRSNNTQKHYFT